MRAVDKLDKVGADGVRAAAGRRGRARRRAGRPVPRARRDHRRPTPSFADAGPRARRRRTRCSTRGSTTCTRRRGRRARALRPVPRWSPTCGSRAGSTTTPARSSRAACRTYERHRSICAGGRYDALATDGRTTYPGVGISLGVTRLLGAADRARACSTPTGRCPSCVLVALPTTTTAPRPREVARTLRARGIADRGGAERGEVRQADPARRPARHPVRLVPRRPATAAPGQGHPQRRPGRRRPGTWQPPDDDLRPRSTAPTREEPHP